MSSSPFWPSISSETDFATQPTPIIEGRGRPPEDTVASWFDRSKPRKRGAGRDLLTSAALLLLVSGSQTLAEDEPAATAPLPPPLRAAPAAAGERQMPDPAPSRNQSGPRAPAITFDRAKPQLSQKKPRPHSAPHLA